MAHVVYLSYSHREEQVVALRLQALGVAHGLTIFVPPADSRADYYDWNMSDSIGKLKLAHTVIAIVLTSPSKIQWDEILTAKQRGQRLIILASQPAADQFAQYAQLQPHLVLMDPFNPAVTGKHIMEHLQAVASADETNTVVIALLTVAIGLVMLSSAKK